ncbi:polysaccharide deacetylase family protein [Halosegnis marinus]|uniref:Polysaccharide deacetylase n=1 Tax=Halosegnis marinus TaxID=3034023 RepID=A0ABD5ZP95_9EURY|nr:polysaccharide deacetylase [Halosegnis sp. DT85]
MDVCLTFDFDAVSPWLHIEGRNTPTNRSRGRYGAEVGAPNVLDFLAARDLPATWFVPGHTIDSFPDPCERVVAEGHEVGHHGWSHTPPGEYDSREAERADIERGIESIERLTGSPPAGYRSPSWDYSEHTVDLLVEFGFDHSSSGMARQYEPYPVRRDDAPADGPYDPGEATDLVEVPVSWHRDDYPPLAFSGSRARMPEAAVFEDWRAQFDHAPDDGVFVLTMHPQVIGREDRLARLGAFVEHARDAGARFATTGDIAGR